MQFRLKLFYLCVVDCYFFFLQVHTPGLLIIIEFSETLGNDVKHPFSIFSYVFGFLFYYYRAWHAYYDYRYNSSMKDHIWKAAISGTHESFFIKYRSTLGNPRFTPILFISFLALFGAITLLVFLCLVFLFLFPFFYFVLRPVPFLVFFCGCCLLTRVNVCPRLCFF